MKRKFGIITTFLLLNTLFLSAQSSEADRYLQTQDYANALALFVDSDSTLENQLNIAYCYYKLGQWRNAKTYYEKVLKKDSTRLVAYLQLGSIYDQELSLPKAIKCYSTLAKLDSSNAHYFKLTGGAYEKAGLIREAFTAYSRALKLNAQDITIYLSLANIFIKNKQYEDADSLVNLAYQLDSGNVKVLLTQARTKYGIRDYNKAVISFKKTRGKLDLNPFYRKMLGYAYLKIDSLDQAIHTLTNLLEDDASEHTHFYLASAYSRKGELDHSIYHYKKAIKEGISPNLADYHAYLANDCKKDKQYKLAIEHYEQAYRYSEDPRYIFHRAQMCDLYYKDKKIALNHYRRYLKYKDRNEEYNAYAKERVQYLSEYIHLTNN